jgi:hypothetical protein
MASDGAGLIQAFSRSRHRGSGAWVSLRKDYPTIRK